MKPYEHKIVTFLAILVCLLGLALVIFVAWLAGYNKGVADAAGALGTYIDILLDKCGGIIQGLV